MEFFKDGGRAFPSPDPQWSGSSGMSLRDWFAGQVLGEMAKLNYPRSPAGDWPTDTARQAYLLADAMIAERGK